jgi:hypothetical protein
MGKPNALSRWVDHRSGQGDNDNLTLLAPELFRIHALAGVRFQGDKRNILQEVRRSLKDGVQLQRWPGMSPYITAPSKHGIMTREDRQEVAQSALVKGIESKMAFGRTRAEARLRAQSGLKVLLMFCGKIYVPNDRDLWHRIVE